MAITHRSRAQSSRQNSSLAVAEPGFALGCEDVRDGLVRRGSLDVIVAVGERPAEPIGEEPADGRLPGPAVADE